MRWLDSSIGFVAVVVMSVAIGAVGRDAWEYVSPNTGPTVLVKVIAWTEDHNQVIVEDLYHDLYTVSRRPLYPFPGDMVYAILDQQQRRPVKLIAKESR